MNPATSDTNEKAREALSARDRAVAEQTPTLADTVPEGWEGTEWVEPRLPYTNDVQFTIRELATGAEYGPFRTEDFFIEEDTQLGSAHYLPPGEVDHKPFVLRCLSNTQTEHTIMECVRDDGEVTLYSVHVLPDNSLPDPEVSVT